MHLSMLSMIIACNRSLFLIFLSLFINYIYVCASHRSQKITKYTNIVNQLISVLLNLLMFFNNKTIVNYLDSFIMLTESEVAILLFRFFSQLTMSSTDSSS